MMKLSRREAVVSAAVAGAVLGEAIMTGYHYGVPGAESMQKDGDGYAFVPVA